MENASIRRQAINAIASLVTQGRIAKLVSCQKEHKQLIKILTLKAMNLFYITLLRRKLKHKASIREFRLWDASSRENSSTLFDFHLHWKVVEFYGQYLWLRFEWIKEGGLCSFVYLYNLFQNSRNKQVLIA